MVSPGCGASEDPRLCPPYGQAGRCQEQEELLLNLQASIRGDQKATLLVSGEDGGEADRERNAAAGALLG